MTLVEQGLTGFVHGVMHLAETQMRRLDAAGHYQARTTKQPGIKHLTLGVLGVAGKELGGAVKEAKKDLGG